VRRFEGKVALDDASYVTCATVLADGGFIVNAEL
jgi:hypothetical protein